MENDRLLAKIRGLLAQAEHPNTSAEEAETYSAQAMRLITKYGIESALIEAKNDEDDISVIIIDFMDFPYTHEKADLLNIVCHEMNCEVICNELPGKRRKGFESANVVGYTSDLKRVELLYTSLIIQVARDMMKAVVPYGEHARPYRRSWFHGFSTAIKHRLVEANKKAKEESENESPGTEIVLANRKAIVKEWFEKLYPDMKISKSRSFGDLGFDSGYTAGRQADLGGTKLNTIGQKAIER